MAMSRQLWWCVAAVLTVATCVALPRDSSATTNTQEQNYGTPTEETDRNGKTSSKTGADELIYKIKKSSFNWDTIDKLTRGKKLPVLKRVKRQGLDDRPEYKNTSEYVTVLNSDVPYQATNVKSANVSAIIQERERRILNGDSNLLSNFGSEEGKSFTTSTEDIGLRERVQRTLEGRSEGGTEEMFLLQALVSTDGVTLHVNGKKVYENWNHTVQYGLNRTERLHAGVHLIALSQQTGAVLRAVNFMTWQLASSQMLVRELGMIGPDRIIVLIGVPDFVRNLSEAAVNMVSNLGSKFFERTAMNEAFLHVSVTGGGPVLLETVRTKRVTLQQLMDDAPHIKLGPPIIAELYVTKTYKDRCDGIRGQSEDHRIFCQRYEGYGDFCRCNATVPVFETQLQEYNSSLPVIAVALVGGIRLPQVLEQILAILTNPAGQRVPMVMCLDSHRQEAEHFARLFNITVVISDPIQFKKGTAARVNYMIQWSVSQVFATFADAAYAIIIEDDLQLAPDFMPFFQQTTGLLSDERELLLCVNAYNYNSYPETAGNLSALQRHQGTPAYGWMITRAVGKEMEEFDIWPLLYNPSDWDYFLQATMMGSRQVLAPEVPRTFHVGGGGVHVTGLEQQRYFNRRLFNDQLSFVRMDIESAQRSRYQVAMHDGIEGAVTLDLTRHHPCHPDLMLGYPANTSFAIYINMETYADEYKAYQTVMRCLGGNDRSPQEHLHMMFLLHVSGHTVYVVGCPASKFYCQYNKDSNSYYKPDKDERIAVESLYFTRVPLIHVTSFRDPNATILEEIYMEDVQDYTANIGLKPNQIINT